MLSGLFLSYHKGYTLRRTMEEASIFLGDFLCLSVSGIVRRTKRGIALRFLFSCEVMCFGWVVFINDWMLCETLLYAFEKLFIYRLFAILAGFLFSRLRS